jgi:hypothetical protein
MNTHIATTSELETRLKQIGTFSGSWVDQKTSGYEKDFADLIDAVTEKGRYYDIIWKGLKIELKKGKGHAWMNLIRYCEYVTDPTTEQVLTLFLFYKEDKLTSIYGVEIDEILRILRLDENHSGTMKAKNLLEISNGSPHPIEAQSRLTKKDLDSTTHFFIKLS